MRSTVLNVPISPELTDAEIDYVSNLSRRAGRLAAEMREGVAISEKSGPHDRVTAADVELSRMIVAGLEERFEQDLIVSEEGSHPCECNPESRIWLVDPIDGTDNYIRNDGQYAVMIGLLIGMRPAFGWVYAPAWDQLFYGGPLAGSWLQSAAGEPRSLGSMDAMQAGRTVRLMMGFRDRKSHPWVEKLPQVEFVKCGSIGLKLAKILSDEADMFVHLSGKLKVWDTAGPAAIALGAGLEVGGLGSNHLGFNLPELQHKCSVIIGRAGSLGWSRQFLSGNTAE